MNNQLIENSVNYIKTVEPLSDIQKEKLLEVVNLLALNVKVPNRKALFKNTLELLDVFN